MLGSFLASMVSPHELHMYIGYRFLSSLGVLHPGIGRVLTIGAAEYVKPYRDGTSTRLGYGIVAVVEYSGHLVQIDKPTVVYAPILFEPPPADPTDNEPQSGAQGFDMDGAEWTYVAGWATAGHAADRAAALLTSTDAMIREHNLQWLPKSAKRP